MILVLGPPLPESMGQSLVNAKQNSFVHTKKKGDLVSNYPWPAWLYHNTTDICDNRPFQKCTYRNKEEQEASNKVILRGKDELNISNKMEIIANITDMRYISQ